MRWSLLAPLAAGTALAGCAAASPTGTPLNDPSEAAAVPNPGPPASPVPQAVPPPEVASTPAPAVAADPPSTSAMCRGDAPRELRAELSRRAGEGKDCYESYLKEGNKGEGRLMVAVKIRGDGQVIGSAVMSDEIGFPALAECVLARFRPPVPTPPAGNCVDVQIPVRFAMKKNQ